MKRQMIDGKAYRIRRGKLVQIPDEWVGQVPNPQTIRKRPSKVRGGKRHRKAEKRGNLTVTDHEKRMKAPRVEEWA